MVGGRGEGWGSDFQSREGWRVGEAGAEITNRCDSSDKRSNLDKSQALELVACVPSPPCASWRLWDKAHWEGDGGVRGTRAWTGRVRARWSPTRAGQGG